MNIEALTFSPLPSDFCLLFLVCKCELLLFSSSLADVPGLVIMDFLAWNPVSFCIVASLTLETPTHVNGKRKPQRFLIYKSRSILKSDLWYLLLNLQRFCYYLWKSY